MSKFLYILHRLPPDEGFLAHNKKQISRYHFKMGSSVYRNQKKEIHIWPEGSNVEVNEHLNIQTGLSAVTGCNTGFLKIFEPDDDTLKIIGDTSGTRVAWYYLNEKWLVISNSQQAIITIIGEYEPNEEAWTWMLATGSLGPDLSWDKRIRTIGPGSWVMFNKKKWELKLYKEQWKFDYAVKTDDAFAKELEELLIHSSGDFRFEDAPALLTLSGGYDSRAALFLLKKSNPAIQTGTWGISTAFQNPGSDAAIARRVSEAWKTNHTEYDLQSKRDFETVLDLVLKYGEGRNDHVNSFMGGIDMWQTISDKGYKWLVRADEALVGYLYVLN
jgi:asparagine synthetase B (glutamine-hydrolysing)